MGQHYRDTPRYNPDLEDAPECEDCGDEAGAGMREDEAAVLCGDCLDRRQVARAERAAERALSRYHGGDTPQTLDEQHAQAWRQKREGR